MLLGLLLVLGGTGFYGLRTSRRATYWRQHRDEPIRSWMTLNYIAHSYQLPPHVLYQAAGGPWGERDRRPLLQIARSQKRTVAELVNALRRAIIHSRPPFVAPPPAPE